MNFEAIPLIDHLKVSEGPVYARGPRSLLYLSVFNSVKKLDEIDIAVVSNWNQDKSEIFQGLSHRYRLSLREAAAKLCFFFQVLVRQGGGRDSRLLLTVRHFPPAAKLKYNVVRRSQVRYLDRFVTEFLEAN